MGGGNAFLRFSSSVAAGALILNQVARAQECVKTYEGCGSCDNPELRFLTVVSSSENLTKDFFFLRSANWIGCARAWLRQGLCRRRWHDTKMPNGGRNASRTITLAWTSSPAFSHNMVVWETAYAGC